MECLEGIKEATQNRMACGLVKAIYGLRQSPPAWYHKIHAFFLSHKFIRSTQGYSLYIHYGRRLLVSVYEDDLVLAAAEKALIGWTKGEVTKTFEMTDLLELTNFLGLEISGERRQRLLTIHQRKYINKILTRHGMQDSRPTLMPFKHHTRLLPSTKDTEASTVSLDQYQSTVGCLMYTMLGTRPDLTYAVGLVSQFDHAPLAEHWVAVKMIFRYLAGT